MRKQTLVAGILLGCMAVFMTGCSSVGEGVGSASRHEARFGQLKQGMSYAEVGRVLYSVDPELRDDIKEAQDQRRQAQKERKEALAELRAVGVNVNPPLRSTVTIDRADYRLVFNDGELASWTVK